MSQLFTPKFTSIQNNQGANMGADFSCPSMFEIYQNGTLLFRWYDAGGTYQNRYLNGTTGENPAANNHPDIGVTAKPFSQITIGDYYGVVDIDPGVYTMRVYNYATINYNIIVLRQTQNGGTDVLGICEAQTVEDFVFNVTSTDTWHKFNLWQGWTFDGDFTPNPFDVGVTLAQIKTPVAQVLNPPGSGNNTNTISVGQTTTYTGIANANGTVVPDSCVNWTWTLQPQSAGTMVLNNNSVSITWAQSGQHVLNAVPHNSNTTINVSASKVINVGNGGCNSGTFVDTGVTDCGAVFNNQYGLSLDVCKKYKQQKDNCANTFQYVVVSTDNTCQGCTTGCLADGTYIRTEYPGCIVCGQPGLYTYQVSNWQEIVANGACGERNGTYTAANCGTDLLIQNCNV